MNKIHKEGKIIHVIDDSSKKTRDERDVRGVELLNTKVNKVL